MDRIDYLCWVNRITNTKIMQVEIKMKLLEAWKYCDDNDKSTEFMLEYMQDFAGVDLGCVMNFIVKTTNKDRQDYIRSVEKSRRGSC